MVFVGANLHDFAVFGALDNLVVVEGVLLVGDDQGHRVGVIDGAEVLHFLLGLGESGIVEDDLQDLEVFGFGEGNGGVKHGDAIGLLCLLLGFCVTFPALLCRVGSDCKEAKCKEYACYNAKKV